MHPSKINKPFVLYRRNWKYELNSFIKLESPGSTDMLISASYPLQDKSNSFQIAWVRNEHEVAEDASLYLLQTEASSYFPNLQG